MTAAKPALAALALLSLASTVPAAPRAPQEAELCPATATANRGGYYRVMIGDTVRSQHTRLDQALLEAVRAETEDATRRVIVDHDFELRVECPESWRAPDPARPDSMTFLGYGRDDTLQLAVGASEELTALIWRNDSIVGCGGECSAYSGLPEYELAFSDKGGARWQKF